MAASTPPPRPPAPAPAPAPASASFLTPSDTSKLASDTDEPVQTVASTVMAEQISHNVVTNSQSASGSPLVDAAVNQTTEQIAISGTENTDTNQPIPEIKTANEQANDANAALTSIAHATPPAAEPSAGSATGNGAEVPSVVPEMGKSDDSQTLLVNGTGESALLGEGTADDVSIQGSADLSLHSDTEGSKGDAGEQKNDEKHHARTNSVKKPTTFSRVSVSKNFLAKSASPAPGASKLGDKPSPAGVQPTLASALKPRLIAKTGASLRDLQKARPGAEAVGGPDASKVWNKNRPAPVAPPKQFTDEELKQQFGIHMTARLQSDEMGKEAKWADIDDEEEDWAPEAVVWMDGTKSNLNAQDAALPEQEQKQAAPPNSKPLEAPKPTLAVRKPIELGPQKTILKPGAGAAAAQARQNGGAETPTDKLSLKAKSPAAVPSKSPWAVLPPVDRASPITPPVQQQQQVPTPAMASQDARAYEQAPPSMPAREIRADTFDRSWREGEGAPRELFNAANGRYEPAPEGRRASRPDASYRKPAVLQRPSHGGPAPAEPSAAFQSRTTAQADGAGPRRRGSSVSQSSMPSVRRISMSQPQDGMGSERRPSMVGGNEMRASPVLTQSKSAQPPVFAQQSAWQQQMPPQPEDGAEPVEDQVVAQERIMKQKRELAKKRREEDEAKLQAEKQERLRARLAQLEGAGKSRKEREAEAAAVATSAAAAQTSPATEIPSQPHFTAPNSEQAKPAQTIESTTMAAPSLEAQSLPSTQPLAKSTQPSSEETTPSPFAAQTSLQGITDKSVALAEQNQRQPLRTHFSPRANSRTLSQQQQVPGPYRAPTSSYSSPGDRKQQPFGRSPNQTTDTFTPWPTTAPSGNVWGTSGIGNGTFEHASSFAPIPMSQQSSSLPPPPGMGGITRPSTSTRISPQGLGQESRSPSLQQSSVAEPTQRAFAPPGLDAFGPQARGNGTSPAPGLGRQTHLPGPIAPPSRAQQQQQPQQPALADPLANWNNAAQRLPYEYHNAAATQRKSDTSPPTQDTIKETFKKTGPAASSRLGGPRKYEATEHTIHDGAGSRAAATQSPAPPVVQTQPAGPFSTSSSSQQEAQKTSSESTVRIPDGSLNPAHGGLPAPQPPIGPPNQQRALPPPNRALYFPSGPLPPVAPVSNQSPPPPETSSHPVHSGDVSHPLVRLPFMLQRPVVKLPPAPGQQPTTAGQQPNQVGMPHRPISNWGAPNSARPLVMQEAWQARFNGLFNRTPIHTETPPSPPKTPPKMQVPAAAVTPVSRGAMSDLPVATNAIVSLPQQSTPPKQNTTTQGFTIDKSNEATSKGMIEDMFKEEQSFGSLPKVSVPRSAKYSTETLKGPAKASNWRFIRPAETQSSAVFNMRDLHYPNANGVYIKLPLRNFRNKMVWRNANNRFGGKAAPRPNKGAGPAPTATNAGENRKTSFQKGQSPGPDSLANAADGAVGRKGSGWVNKGTKSNNARAPVPATPS